MLRKLRKPTFWVGFFVGRKSPCKQSALYAAEIWSKFLGTLPIQSAYGTCTQGRMASNELNPFVSRIETQQGKRRSPHAERESEQQALVFYFATLTTLNASLLIIRGDISSLGHSLHNRS